MEIVSLKQLKINIIISFFQNNCLLNIMKWAVQHQLKGVLCIQQ